MHPQRSRKKFSDQVARSVFCVSQRSSKDKSHFPRDSNLQFPDYKSDVLSIRPRGPLRQASLQAPFACMRVCAMIRISIAPASIIAFLTHGSQQFLTLPLISKERQNLHSSGVEHQPCKLKAMGTIPSGVFCEPGRQGGDSTRSRRRTDMKEYSRRDSNPQSPP